MNACPRGGTKTQGIDRRRFLSLGVIGGGASLLALGGCAGPLAPGPKPKPNVTALLLSCMDYRLISATEKYMADQGLRGDYDHVILAGASLGANTEKFPAWGTTFREHLEVAIKLHNIKKVMVLDHRKCGAYDVILGEECCKDPDKELAVHTEELRKLRTWINRTHSQLRVELLLMDLDGKVTPILPIPIR